MPIDDAFFQPDWARACWSRWAGPGLMLGWSIGSGCGSSLQKEQEREGPAGASPVAAPMPKSVSF